MSSNQVISQPQVVPPPNVVPPPDVVPQPKVVPQPSQKVSKTINKVVATGASNMGYVISMVIAIVLAVVASISDIVNDTMSLAVAITFLYIISQFVIENYIGDRCKGKGTVLKPIIGTCSIFLLTWMAVAFFNIYFVPKIKNKDDDKIKNKKKYYK